MKNREEIEKVPFGAGIENPYNSHFVGQSYLNVLLSKGLTVCNVVFEPGCRNDWHIHNAKENGGQFLMAVYGRGYVQLWGQEAKELLPGDCFYVPANTKHWHGAAKDSVFAHLAIEIPGKETSTTWLEHVSEDDYAKANLIHRSQDFKQTAGHKEMGDFAPAFAEFNDDILFGKCWSRTDLLPVRRRCMVTVISLVSQGIVDSSLEYHIRNAKAHGISKDEMAESLTQVAFYAGWPKVWAALRIAKKVYEED